MAEGQSNIDRFQADLEKLDERGHYLKLSMQRMVNKAIIDAEIREAVGEKADKFIEGLPVFDRDYEAWYSAGCAVIAQILPNRLGDFTSHYNAPKNRKEIKVGNYAIEDFLQGMRVTRGGEVIVDRSAAIARFDAQRNILAACKERFKSSLFDIRQMVQADLFDSELVAAVALLKHGFARAAGAMAGVVLEHHLQQVYLNHDLKPGKKNPTLGDLGQGLKDAEVIDTPSWRRLQHLSDIRNLCDHKKDREPTVDEVQELIAGVERVVKTLF